MDISPARKPWYRVLYIQVLIAVALGILVGRIEPEFGKKLEPLAKGFINLVKMMIAPIIFCTIVHGIASMGDLKKLGRVGLKALLYFEVVSTIALVIGLIVINVLKPGVGFTPAGETFHATAAAATSSFGEKAQHLSFADFLLHIIPDTFFGAFVSGNLLQVLFVSILTALALSAMGDRAKPVLHGIDCAADIFFRIMGMLVKLAPLGAFGAMAFAIANYGMGALGRLAWLMVAFYVTSAVFVIVVLGGIARWCGFSIFRYLGFIKNELFLVLGTSSSETALPGLIQRLQRLGCSRSTVGLVVPTGYSFNLDGTNIYMTMAAIFLAQATNTPMNLTQQITLLLVAMLTSKGASGVTGAGFITLAATLQAVPGIPLSSLALLVGIDRFMSECRAITNFIGNGVATVAISRWEKEITAEELRQNLNLPDHIELPPPQSLEPPKS
ncbi:MAG: dicarboxylate/amino acid:cation symporter [Verrucomicrobiaceae bacterium]|nr:dicarboxylate/amino acid:cation symporter [Verrucomicrobiaceae bacterium]